MTTNFTNKQNISSNQNEELAPVVEESTQDIEELNEAELDDVAGGVSCRNGVIVNDGVSYHLDTPIQSNSVMQVRKRP